MTNSIEEVRKFFEGDKYATEATGIVIEKAEKGHSIVTLEPDGRHLNAVGGLMGAVYYTMADFAFAVASNPDAGHAPITFTLSSQINFLTAARGQYLTAEARAVRKGKKASFYEAEIRDELDTLIATVSSTGFTMDK